MKHFSKEEIDALLDSLDFSKMEGELIPVITQDYITNEVLILAFANKDAVQKSLETGQAHFYSRSRNALWKKGESSGHVEEIESVFVDCDQDSLLLKVKQIGAACHKGYYSCFYTKLDGGLKNVGKKIFNPEDVYKK